jgi:hypothetical protein
MYALSGALLCTLLTDRANRLTCCGRDAIGAAAGHEADLPAMPVRLRAPRPTSCGARCGHRTARRSTRW